MKTRLRQYKGSVQKNLSENYYVKRRVWEKKWEAFLQKGHEKMTVMFIPHNEKKIFNFQISKFTISFFVMLFMIIIVTSAFAVIRNSSVKQEEEKLMTNYKDVRAQLYRYEKKTYEVYDLLEDLKPEIEELYDIAAGGGEKTSIWFDPDDLEKNLTEEQIKQRRMLPDEVFMLQVMQRDIICATNTIKTVKNFVDVRGKVINDTPSIVSNRGHITSLFGWRRSPFGFGRDFHTGIDIAAPPDTEIRATAPGVVTVAGWGGGYGNMVQIQHKYGFETVYGHCSRVVVGKDDNVSKGQVIAYVGSTGSATGPHCHYEIRLGGVAINPYPYMTGMW